MVQVGGAQIWPRFEHAPACGAWGSKMAGKITAAAPGLSHLERDAHSFRLEGAVRDVPLQRAGGRQRRPLDVCPFTHAHGCAVGACVRAHRSCVQQLATCAVEMQEKR